MLPIYLQSVYDSLRAQNLSVERIKIWVDAPNIGLLRGSGLFPPQTQMPPPFKSQMSFVCL